MMYTSVMDKSLELNNKFGNILSAVQLEEIMKEFDDYEIERFNSGFYNQDPPQQYWRTLRKFVDQNKRKSVNLENVKMGTLRRFFFMTFNLKKK